MEAKQESIKIRTSYNLSGVDFTPRELFNEIKKIFPEFKITFKPDSRQKIADSWPGSIDDSEAKSDWNWKHRFDTKSIVKLMSENI
jgi:nucleoside-diphosphate-sugar epimerase